MSPREAELTRQLEQALQLHAALQRENQLLREKVNLLLRRVFGASSEKMDLAQLELLLSGSEPVEPAAESKTEAPKPKAPVQAPRKARLPRLPDNLPVVEEVIDPEPVKAAPAGPPHVCVQERVGEGSGDRPFAAHPARALSGHPGTAGAGGGSKVLRSRTAVSAGTDFGSALRH